MRLADLTLPDVEAVRAFWRAVLDRVPSPTVADGQRGELGRRLRAPVGRYTPHGERVV